METTSHTVTPTPEDQSMPILAWLPIHPTQRSREVRAKQGFPAGRQDTTAGRDCPLLFKYK